MINAIFRARRPLKPNRSQREIQTIETTKYINIRVHIIKLYDIPVRNEEISNKKQPSNYAYRNTDISNIKNIPFNLQSSALGNTFKSERQRTVGG